MLQVWAIQFGASLADKVESNRILGYVVHCLSSIVVNEHSCTVETVLLRRCDGSHRPKMVMFVNVCEC